MLLVDQPGFGGSDKPAVEGHFFTFAADQLAALLDELGIERVHLLGNSLGGGTATRFALTHPDRVGRLVLMGPGGLQLNLFSPDPTEGIKRLYGLRRRPDPRERCGRSSPRWSTTRRWSPTSSSRSGSPPPPRPAPQEAMASMGARSGTPRPPRTACSGARRYKLRQHTLLTWGREDRVNPLDGAFLALKLIPKASLHVFPNCGHWAQIEAADEFHAVATRVPRPAP